MRLAGAAVLAAALAAVPACNGTTGDQLVTFAAYGAGAPGAGQPFTVGDFSVQLTTAKMRVGAVYFDEAPPGTGFDSPECISPGVYAAQVAGPLELDLLSTTPQEFAVYGNGTADVAQSWQIWLTDGDVNAVNSAHVVDLQGTATRASDGAAFSFGAVVTINDNRLPSVTDPSQPGLDPICKERIVQIATDLAFHSGGNLYVTVDPRAWFQLGVDFSQLPPVSDPECLAGDPEVSLSPAAYALTPHAPPPSGQVCGGSGQPCCTGSASPCLGALACTAGTCGAAACIPDSSFATGAGATAGVNLFSGIQTAGAAAYTVCFGAHPCTQD